MHGDMFKALFVVVAFLSLHLLPYLTQWVWQITKHFGHILDNRPLPVGCSTLTQSDVTSEPIAPDPTTQLTKVSSILWANSVPIQAQYTQCGDVTQCLHQVRCSLSINTTVLQYQHSEDSVPPQGRYCSRTQYYSHYHTQWTINHKVCNYKHHIITRLVCNQYHRTHVNQILTTTFPCRYKQINF